MTKYTFLLLSLVALAGCGDKDGASRPENLLAGNDFESLEGWTNDVKLVSLTKEKAHSGLYSVHVGPGMDYSNGFNGELGKLSPTKFDKVQIKGWVFVPDAKSTAALITQVIDPTDTSGKPALWEATSLERATKAPNRWVEIDKTLTLPANVGPNFMLKVYLWNSGSGSIAYLDDLQILRAK